MDLVKVREPTDSQTPTLSRFLAQPCQRPNFERRIPNHKMVKPLGHVIKHREGIKVQERNRHFNRVQAFVNESAVSIVLADCIK